MKYYIIAGEASGDLHGSNLIKGLLASDPQADIRFWGGDKMSDAAGSHGTLVKHYKESSIMGFWEVVKNIRTISRHMEDCRKDMYAFEPDALILIDYPGFNLRMAQFATEKLPNTSVFYYIAPKVWAWKENRVKKLKKYVDKLFIIFPFETEYFRRHGIETYYAGNPLMDSLPIPGEKPADPVIALVPGSRKHEIDYNLPFMVEAAASFPRYRFIVTGVDWLDKGLYEKYLAGSDIEVVFGKTYEVLARAQAALVTSGTATLETALMGVPQVVCFRGPWLSIAIAKGLVKVKYISLVNLVLDKQAVQELIQEAFTPQRAVEELAAILPGGARSEQMRRDYELLKEMIGGPGASERVATEMVRLLNVNKKL